MHEYGAAEAAKKLGEELFVGDARRRAALAYNLGHAQGEARRHATAYETLRDARRQLGSAFGEDAIEVAYAELALGKSAPRRGKSLRHRHQALPGHRPGDALGRQGGLPAAVQGAAEVSAQGLGRTR